MGKNLLVGVGSKARKVKALYVGVGGKARKVKKVYVGVGGKARLVYQSYIPVTGISLSGSGLGYRCTINAVINPSNASNKTITWRITENKIYEGGTTMSIYSSSNTQCIILISHMVDHASDQGYITLEARSADGTTARVKVYCHWTYSHSADSISHTWSVSNA